MSWGKWGGKWGPLQGPPTQARILCKYCEAKYVENAKGLLTCTCKRHREELEYWERESKMAGGLLLCSVLFLVGFIMMPYYLPLDIQYLVLDVCGVVLLIGSIIFMIALLVNDQDFGF
jgi:hypothetical protein